MLALGVGVPLDLDHVHDYYQWYARGNKHKVYVLLHAWEYSLAGILALVLGLHHPFLLAFTLGHLGHVAIDNMYNGLSRFSYSITYRALKGLDKASIIPHNHSTMHSRKWRWLFSFDRPVESWLRKRTESWFKKFLAVNFSEQEHLASGIASFIMIVAFHPPGNPSFINLSCFRQSLCDLECQSLGLVSCFTCSRDG